MPWFGRPDGTPIEGLPMLRRMMPFLMPSRTESLVYFEQQIDVTETLRYLERRRAQGAPVNLFQVMMAGLVRVLAMRPQLHRFVVGRRVYRRRTIELSFAVKKQFTDQARLTTVKVAFDPDDSLDDAARRVREAVSEGKGDSDTSSEKEMGFFTKLPRFALRMVMGLQRTLDYFNLVPTSMMRDDPMYASMFVANLGSIGLDAAFHHLYEYGTIPLFAAIGRIHKAPMVMADGTLQVREVVTVRYTFDERIADGLYCARALDLYKRWIENPTELEKPMELTDDIAASPSETTTVPMPGDLT